MAENNFKANVDALLSGMEGFLNTKTVVGEAIKVDGSILIPLADVSFGVGAGAFEGNEKNRGGGGLGAKITPSAILIINNTGTRVISVKSPGTIAKLVEMAPDIINRFRHINDKVDVDLDDVFEKNEE